MLKHAPHRDKHSLFFRTRAARAREFFFDKGVSLACNSVKTLVAFSFAMLAVEAATIITSIISNKVAYSRQVSSYEEVSLGYRCNPDSINSSYGVFICNDLLQVKADFVDGEPKICDLKMYNGKFVPGDNSFIPVFSSLPTSKPISSTAKYGAMEKFFHSSAGKDIFCRFLQASIDSVYKAHGLGGQALSLSEDELGRIKSRLGSASMVKFPLKVIAGGFLHYTSIVLIDDYGSEFHELLHLVSKPKTRLIEANLFTLVFGRIDDPKVAVNRPYLALHETGVSLLSSGYDDLRKILSDSLMALDPDSRKTTLDKIILSTLGFAQQKEAKEARDFLNAAIRHSIMAGD